MLNIDNEFKNLIDSLTPEEYNLLEKNILEYGIRDAVVTWNGFVIDGHNRYGIAQKHGLTFETFDMEFASREQVINWIIENQLGKRNLTEAQKSYLRGKRYESEKKTHGGEREQGATIASCSTSEILANELNVSSRTIKNDAQFSKGLDLIASVAPELKTDILHETSELTKKDVQSFAEISKQADAEQKQLKQQLADAAKEAEIQASERAKQAEIQARIQAENEAFMQEQAERTRILEAKLQAERERFEAEKIEREKLYQLELQKIEADKVENERKAVAAKLKEIEEEAQRKQQERDRKKEEHKANIEMQAEAIKNGELPILNGLYDVISIDPPWNYGREYDPVGSRVANPYPEMTIEQIKAIKLPALNDSIVLLWTTHKFLPEAFEILKHWGYEYKATMVWNKENIGMGAWLRMQCEFCLVGIKGKPYWQNTTVRDIITETRREHSRKPDIFFENIEKITAGRRLEYFSRERRDGWDVFGNDTEKF